MKKRGASTSNDEICFLSVVQGGQSEEGIISKSDEELDTLLGLKVKYASEKPEVMGDRTVETSECIYNESGIAIGALSPSTLHEILLRVKPTYDQLDALCTRLDKMNLPVVHQAIVDDHGRTPLHIAASSNHCNCKMVARLLCGPYYDRWPATAVDASGMTPLHCAVKSCPRSFKLFRSFYTRSKERNAIEKIEVLVKAHPSALFMVDDDGRTPIALARHRKITNPDVLDLLWLSRTYMRTQPSQFLTKSTISFGSASIGYSPQLPFLLEPQNCDAETHVSSLEFTEEEQSEALSSTRSTTKAYIDHHAK